MSKSIYNLLLHALCVGAVIFGISQCSENSKRKDQLVVKDSIVLKQNEIIEILEDSAGNKIIASLPTEGALSEAASETKHLIDSVSEPLNLSKNQSVKYYNSVPIESSVKLKADNVTNEIAEAENENWYMSYNFKDSVFNGRYKTIYNSVLTEKDYKVLGLNIKPSNKVQFDWITDKGAKQLSPTTLIVKEPVSRNKRFQINNVNKFRSFDNSVLSGAGLEVGLNRTTVEGQYMYNFSTKQPEWEVSLKFGLFKP